VSADGLKVVESLGFAESAPKYTLGDLLSELSRMERLADADESRFDPEVILGIRAPAEPVSVEERERVLALLREKVDGIDFVVTEFEDYAARMQARASRLQKRAQSARRRAERLELYVQTMMQAYGFDRLPGHERVVEIRYASNPALVVLREPTAEDAMSLSKYVVEVPTSYVWDAAAVKAALQAKAEFSFATLQYKARLHFDDRDKPAVKK